MNYIKYPSAAEVDKAVAEKEPLLVLISFDGKTAVMSHIDEAVESCLKKQDSTAGI